jgi:peptidoglycan/xylan/chitin deacetylase (PgdA/CDA1 family)
LRPSRSPSRSRRLRPARRLILTFHGIGDPPPHVAGSERDVWVDRDRFEATLDAVAGRPDVLLTFDDGNRSDVEVALPELGRRGLTAAFFVVADRLDAPGYLTSGELTQLADAGMTIGSHGFRHTSWRRLGQSELRDDLDRARLALAGVLERPVTVASCPFGEYDRRVLRQLRRLGHERVYTSDGGSARAGAWVQARNTVRAGWEPTPAGFASYERTRALGIAKRVVKRVR